MEIMKGIVVNIEIGGKHRNVNRVIETSAVVKENVILDNCTIASWTREDT